MLVLIYIFIAGQVCAAAGSSREPILTQVSSLQTLCYVALSRYEIDVFSESFMRYIALNDIHESLDMFFKISVHRRTEKFRVKQQARKDSSGKKPSIDNLCLMLYKQGLGENISLIRRELDFLPLFALRYAHRASLHWRQGEKHPIASGHAFGLVSDSMSETMGYCLFDISSVFSKETELLKARIRQKKKKPTGFRIR